MNKRRSSVELTGRIYDNMYLVWSEQSSRQLARCDWSRAAAKADRPDWVKYERLWYCSRPTTVRPFFLLTVTLCLSVWWWEQWWRLFDCWLWRMSDQSAIMIKLLRTTDTAVDDWSNTKRCRHSYFYLGVPSYNNNTKLKYADSTSFPLRRRPNTEKKF